MSQNSKKYDCQCGAAFDTVEELDKHNHEAHWEIITIILIPNIFF